VTGGAYDAEEDSWQPAGRKYLFPVEIMRSMFRHRVLKCLQRCRDRSELAFVGGCTELGDDSAHACPLRGDNPLKGRQKLDPGGWR
jgi:hypothetical protein